MSSWRSTIRTHRSLARPDRRFRAANISTSWDTHPLAEGTKALDTGRARGAGYSRGFAAIAGGRGPPRCRLIVDGSDSTTASTAIGYVSAMPSAAVR